MDLATGASSRGLPQQMESLVIKRLILQTMTAVSVLALALAVGGCGSSSDKGDDKVVTPLVPPTVSAPGLMCGAGTMENTEGTQCVATPVPADAIPGLYKAAHDARSAAEVAGKMATDAEKAAMENSVKLTTMPVAGDSTVAMMNAQAVLDAKRDADQAVVNAQTALTNAETAQMTVTANHADNASLIAALDAAVKVAKTQLAAAMKVADSKALQGYVDMVTGGKDADPQGTARSTATKVGMDIAMALLPTSSDAGSGVRVYHNSPAAIPDAVAKELRVEMDTNLGMTWAMVVGEDKLMDSRLGDNNANVKIASVAGMTASKLHGTALSDDGGPAGDGKYADGAITESSNYMGIPGDVYCLGADCEVDSDGKLVGSWYFTPQHPKVYYIKNPVAAMAEATPYVAETLYAVFGHWLTPVANDAWAVHTYAEGKGGVLFDLTTVNAATATTLKDTSATYSGTAAGMSVRKMDKADGKGQDIDSGRFTAKVELTAEFAAKPMLSGTIKSFEGSAVNPDWTVSLSKKELLPNGTLVGGSGATVATGRDGVWTAESYGGDPMKRPAGIVGGFNAHFSDGHAAGAYGTQKD